MNEAMLHVITEIYTNGLQKTGCINQQDVHVERDIYFD